MELVELLDCIKMLHHVFTFLAHDVFFVLFWVIHDKGRYIDLYMFLVSHCFDLYL